MKLHGLVQIGLGAVLLVGLFQQALAQTVDMSKIVLEVSVHSNDGQTDQHHYNLADLEELGLSNLTTQSPWSDAEQTFSGVLLRTLINAIGIRTGTLTATALNDYAVTIPVADFMKHDVLLATQREGRYLSIRDRGPLWVIYPWSSEPSLQNEMYYARSIWQLNRIEIRQN